MEELKKVFDAAKVRYDAGDVPLSGISTTSLIALSKLVQVERLSYGTCAGKQYSVLRDGSSRSRPFLNSLLLKAEQFAGAWEALIKTADARNHCFNTSEEAATKTVYSAVMAFALCYDLWKPKSRKTPGTYLEVVLGSLLAKLAPEAKRGKFIKLPQDDKLVELPEAELVAESDVEAAVQVEDAEEAPELVGSVSTDIVFEFPDSRGIVIPAKITTRERIVQPFAHQRILDSAFGDGRYKSLLICVSETQRDDKNTRVNEICVPGTIALFQRYLAKLGGIYYLDPPQRYLKLSEAGVIPVRSVGSLLVHGFHEVITQLGKAQPA